MALSAYALRATQFKLISVSSEGHLLLEAERVFHPYLRPHCSGMIEISQISLPTHALQAVRVTLKLVSKERLFPPEAEPVFRP
jgi:hypothetical protein